MEERNGTAKDELSGIVGSVFEAWYERYRCEGEERAMEELEKSITAMPCHEEALPFKEGVLSLLYARRLRAVEFVERAQHYC